MKWPFTPTYPEVLFVCSYKCTLSKGVHSTVYEELLASIVPIITPLLPESDLALSIAGPLGREAGLLVEEVLSK